MPNTLAIAGDANIRYCPALKGFSELSRDNNFMFLLEIPQVNRN